MAHTQEEEIVLGTASPVTSDHKRKHDDLEPDSLQLAPELNGNSDSDSVKNIDDQEEDADAKRQRVDDKPADLAATENGHQQRDNDPEEVGVQPPVENLTPVEDEHQQAAAEEAASEEAPKQVSNEELAAEDKQPNVSENTSNDKNKLENAEGKASEGEPLKHPEELDAPAAAGDNSQQEVVGSAQNEDTSEGKSMSRKMEVPNNKVGVLIGKAGDTIRSLQTNSGARIQITRDADANPHSGSRPVELIGTLENITKAEKLIKDVIAEADAGGSPALVARGFNTVQAAGAGEQIQIQVPNEKVGLIIGKGGETIKNLQTRSGARIQLIPQHLPEGDQSKERTVRVSGDKKQIEFARELIKEVMDQLVRPSPVSGGYNQQQNSRPLGPAGHWGPRGHNAQQGGYDYQQRGPYQSHNQQYTHQPYGNYPPQQMGPRSNMGWEQRPHGPHGGYDYYGGPGHASDASKPIHAHAAGPSPMMGPSQPNYNYGQPQGGDYGQPAYPQTTPSAQSYGQGYNEPKYDNQVSMQQPYGGYVAPQQPSAFPQGTAPGYGQQDQYGRPPSYGMPQQGPQVQSYGQPRAAQPTNMPYQAPITSTQSYGQAAPTQQPYPYASGGQMQQTYPHSSAPSVDGYNQPLPTVAAPGYPQQGVQPVSGYGQPGGQQASGYPQAGTTGSYVQYPSSQPGYTEQAAPNTAAAYGVYQGAEDPAYSGAPAAAYGAQPVVQPTYSQPATVQPVYDQSVPQSGGYATAPAAYR